MFFNLAEEDKLLTGMTVYSYNLKEFFENVRGWPHSEDARTLEGAVLFPTGDALFAEKLPTVIALHWILQDL